MKTRNFVLCNQQTDDKQFVKLTKEQVDLLQFLWETELADCGFCFEEIDDNFFDKV